MAESASFSQPTPKAMHSSLKKWWWVWSFLLIGILMIGAYFRWVGINWDDDFHLHPDERFMTMVASSISSAKSLSEYFDTGLSPMNPHNRGYGFYVYGTLPLFIVRIAGEAVGRVGYSEIHLVGRFLSALADLMTVLLVYRISLLLYRNYRMSLLAALFYALAVLPIQLSHYFTVDTFTTFFTFLAFYYSVRVMTEPVPGGVNLANKLEEPLNQEEAPEQGEPAEVAAQLPAASQVKEGIRSHLWLESLAQAPGTILPHVLFGLALGMAMASKVSAAPVAVLLPVAAWVALSRVKREELSEKLVWMARNLVIAALIAFLTFRICQPYAFSGPGFFGLMPNPKWLDNLRDLSAQSGGDVDFPPALQWARRPVTFAWENMVVFGMGLPLGLLSWLGFFWMAWRMVSKGEWRQHILLWGWTLAYFIWQSLNFSRSMRYQMPVYPTLVIMAAWAIFALANSRMNSDLYTTIPGSANCPRLWRKVVAGFLAVGVLVVTGAWAFAFTRIYTRPVTRVAASEWIYQNVPAAINLRLSTDQGIFNQPLAFRSGLNITSAEPLRMAFVSQQDGMLTELNFGHVVDLTGGLSQRVLRAQIVDRLADDADVLTFGELTSNFPVQSDPRGDSYSLVFNYPLSVQAGKAYFLIVQPMEPEAVLSLSGSLSLGIQIDNKLSRNNEVIQQALADPVSGIQPGQEFGIQFTALRTGSLREVFLPHLVDWEEQPGLKSLRIEIVELATGEESKRLVELAGEFKATNDPRGQSYRIMFDPPYTLRVGQLYQLRLIFADGKGRLALYGSKHAIESSWDDPLPLGMEGFDPFDYYTGLFRSDLNFEMYWDDNEDKRQRFLNILDQADYIFISSNRQWGTTVRVPERYPLTTLYYRSLLGCPEDKDIVWCYRVAQPGMFKGKLGFDLIYVNQSDPNLGPLRINTQFAEEAFTVYDHPKVLIFKKSSEYRSEAVRALLETVDLTRVVHLIPGQAASYQGDLLMPEVTRQIQQAGGTWSRIFNRQSPLNAYPALGLFVWYLVITLLGWVVYPLVRLALGALPDRGYPLTRVAGMTLLAYICWLGGSAGIPFSRLNISLVVLLLLIVNLGLGIMQWEQLKREFSQRKGYLLMVEGLTLGFFLLFLLIRLGNPDLWHPYKGGEKPMDFSYLNAVIKSTVFPPYDPWFAGGYINYYYYGFVVVGVLIKWLGIIPSIAYNLVIPMLFSLSAMGAFSAGWNLLARTDFQSDPQPEGPPEVNFQAIADTQAQLQVETEDREFSHPPKLIPFWKRWWSVLEPDSKPLLAGLAAALGLVLLGNLGTVRMIWHGLQRLAAPGGEITGGGFFNFALRWLWTFQGLIRFFQGNRLPYGPGDWYWIPSRTIPAEPITEFPFFTFLYADLHAHMIALPITLLALVWVMAILRGRWQWGKEKLAFGPPAASVGLHFGSSIFLGAMAIGALRPTNTWDMPTYLVLGGLILIYVAGRYAVVSARLPVKDSVIWTKLTIGFGAALLLVVLSFWFYQPYAHSYIQPYNKIILWREGRYTPFWSYLTHWGLFLFVIVSWLVWETIDWMAQTPLSAVRKLKPYRSWIVAALIVLVVLLIILPFIGYAVSMSPMDEGQQQTPPGAVISWIVLPVAAWAAVLILRPGQSDMKRIVLFLVGTALVLTLAVELVVLEGDIGRMNTVFKFYFQAWTLLAVSAGAALVWLYPVIIESWKSGWRSIWQIAFAAMVGGALLFPLLGGLDKITDRMSSAAPHTLDGMEFMKYSTYSDQDKVMDLSQDYLAIRWMQDNVQGSPVIVEGNTPEYRWGTRYTIYTGLPGVVGWNWHQRQQRGVVSSEWVTSRIEEINWFYNTVDREQTRRFLEKYGIRYIVVGQLEKAYYNAIGLEKFVDWNGDLWREVYRVGDTVIYEVLKR